MARLTVVQLSALQDNYIYLVHDVALGITAVVDPSLAEPVLKALDNLNWKLDFVLNTHHHWDHTGGNLELKRATQCAVVGPRKDKHRIPGIDIEVGEGDAFRLGSVSAKILEIPGHTHGHIAFWIPGERLLFCGDTLFSLGCGRLFEGTPAQMWESLQKLIALPDDTLIYCGHEYTQSNASFALAIDSQNEKLAQKKKEVDRLRELGKSTVPSLLGEEKSLNPFLRPDDVKIRRALHLETSGPLKVFTEIRRRKDHWKGVVA